MGIDLSKLGHIKLESLIQQGLDTILNTAAKTDDKEKQKVTLVKRSLDTKGELYRLPPSHDFTIAAYQVRHQGAIGSILITLDSLRDFYKGSLHPSKKKRGHFCLHPPGQGLPGHQR